MKLQGMDELTAALKRKAREAKNVKTVVLKNGSQLQQKAMQSAPVDTGTLKRSIELDISNGGYTASVTPVAEYAPYVEYGTRYMSAQPFLRPAYNEQKENFKSDIEKVIKK